MTLLNSKLLYAASSNPGKLREFREAAAATDFHIEPLPNFSAFPRCDEDGETFEANARKKALHYSAYADAPVFADDSGVCVDALDGAPGVYSARFSGSNATDESNNAKLLEELQRKADRSRAAHYVCVIVLARRGNVIATAEGRADGTLLTEPRGSGGFGYDPLFFFPPLGKSFGELTPQEKFKVSHRGEALRKLFDLLIAFPGY